jgi:hypothetical protein
MVTLEQNTGKHCRKQYWSKLEEEICVNIGQKIGVNI